MTTILTGTESTSNTVTEAMFGGNNLFKYNLLNGPNATFPIAADLLAVTGLRYPGGAMAETDFDVTQPNAEPLTFPANRPFVGVSEFLNFAEETGRAATIVLPTAKMYTGALDANHDAPRAINLAYLEQVVSYVSTLITYGDSGPDALPDTPIAAFEIGNEYWGSGQMTSAEYGQVANALSAAIKGVFDRLLGANAPHPDVLVQMGGQWDAQFRGGLYSTLSWADKVFRSNQDIIDQITNPNAKAAITGLVEHYYYSDQTTIFAQTSTTMEYINSDIQQWVNNGFAGSDLVITEWNVKQDNSAQFGLKGASVVIEQMEYMLRLGVDAAFAWPVADGPISLAGTTGMAPELSPSGAAFKLMAESLIGTHLLAGGISEGPLEVNAFGSETKAVFFVMSRSDVGQQISLDVSSIVSEYTHLSGVKIGVSTGTAVNDETAHAELVDFDAAHLGNGTSLSFLLGPFEVMRVTFDLPTPMKFIGTAAADKFLTGQGNDSLVGNGGDDSLAGGKGNDFLGGGMGRDLLDGWSGKDSIHGGDGDDRLNGQQDNDEIYGDIGNDSLSGSTGDDMLSGGDGRDTLKGGDGNDVLIGGPGRDYLTGDLGADRFVFDFLPTSIETSDVIADFQRGIDKVALNQLGFLGLAPGVLSATAFNTNATGLAADASDRITYESDTGYLWYDRDGTGVQFGRIFFADLASNIGLSQNDFSVF